MLLKLVISISTMDRIIHAGLWSLPAMEILRSVRRAGKCERAGRRIAIKDQDSARVVGFEAYSTLPSGVMARCSIAGFCPAETSIVEAKGVPASGIRCPLLV